MINLIKVCKICGKEFSTSSSRRTCCSVECSNKNGDNSNRRKKRVEPVIKKCAFCGKEFSATHGKKIYCSDECRTKATTAHRTERRIAEREKFKELGLDYSPYNKKCLPQRGEKSNIRKPLIGNKTPKKFKMTAAQIEQRDRLKEALLQRRLARELRDDFWYEDY